VSSLSDRIAARSGLCHFEDRALPTGSPELGYCSEHLREVNRRYRPRPTWVRLAEERRLPGKSFDGRAA